MRIQNLRRLHGRPNQLARFDAQVTPEVTLCHLTLRRSTAGHLYAQPALHAGQKTAHLEPMLTREIVSAVAAALGGVV